MPLPNFPTERSFFQVSYLGKKVLRICGYPCTYALSIVLLACPFDTPAANEGKWETSLPMSLCTMLQQEGAAGPTIEIAAR